ncbi:MAG: hypothetical protein Q4G61_06410 [Tissierellia bacterium]|nr:hypothetical protein [Tissierellia bacterium]
MNDVLLINKCNPNEQLEKTANISIIIGQMHKQATCDLIIEVLEKENYINLKDLILKYNGIVVTVEWEKVPNLLTALLKNGLLVYGAYELYE